MARSSWTFRPALLLMSGRTLGLVATALMPLVLVRVLPQAEFGTYKQLFLIYGTLYALAQVGMAESLFYFLPQAKKHAGRYVVNSMLMLALAGLVGIAILVASGKSIATWLSNPALIPHLPMLGVYLLLTLVSTTLEIAMISRKRYSWASATYLLSDILRTLLFVLPLVFFHSLRWLLAGAIAFAAIRVVFTCLYVRREFRMDMQTDGALLRRQFSYALPFEMAVIVDTLQANFHQYAVSHYFDAATFAIYSVGCLQIPFVGLAASSVGNVLMVGMAEEIRDGRPEATAALWHETTRKLSLIFFPLVGLLAISAREFIVLLFTEQYLASVPIFTVWLAFILLGSLQTDSVLRVYAETRFLFVLNTVRLVVILALIHWFFSMFWLLGPVLVTLLAAVVTKVMALARIRKLMRVPFSGLLPWKSLGGILAIAGLAALPAALIKLELQAPPFFVLSATALVYSVCYFALLYSFGLLTDSESRTLRRLFSKSKNWLKTPSPEALEAGDLTRN